MRRRHRDRVPGGRRSARPPARSLAGLLAATLFAASGAGAASLSSDCAEVRPPDLRRICEAGELRVARYQGERPPFFTHDGERWVGFDVDLARDIAVRLGVRYREDAIAGSFDEVVDRVAAGDADIGLSKLSATLARATRVRFTRPYLTVYQALLVHRLSIPFGSEPFAALNESPFVVGALAGSSYVEFAETTLGRATVRPYDGFEAMMADVTSGEIDAVLLDSARADTWRRGNSEQLVHVRTSIDRSRRDPLAIAVAWEDTHLLAWLEQYLAEIRADGTADRLYRKWFVEARGSER